ncbi:MAG: HAD family hydrolase [Blautia sp.]|nr:HAD family hydrolase [Blautia sp.]
MIKACIFDLDGTLLYTLDSMAKPGNEVLKALGLHTLPVENYRYYCGDGARKLTERILYDAGDKELAHFEEAYPMYRQSFVADPLYGVRKYPGMDEVLKAMKEQGLFLAVCSNKPDEAAVQVIEQMYPGVFDVVIGQKDGRKRKPSPDMPLAAAQSFGVSPEECMYVGDSGTDMLTGKAAGMFTVGVLWGYRDLEELEENGADNAVFAPEDLLGLLQDCP